MGARGTRRDRASAGTIEDRSIPIRLRRRRPDEAVESLRLDRANGLEKVARMAARWTADHAAELAAADPQMPVGIVNRAADNWRPLLAVADLAGEDWPQRAREAAAELSAGGDDLESIRVALLADIRATFAAKAVDRIKSEDLAAHLGSLDDRPWAEYRGGKPITKAQIPRLLKPFGISPVTIRLADDDTKKGYHLSAFADAFARYLPPENVTTSQPEDLRGTPPNFKTSQGNGCDVSEPAKARSISAACDGVTAHDTQSIEEEHFQERAAIHEFEGGYSRIEAERMARPARRRHL